MANFCPECGTPASSTTSKFCANCGSTLGQANSSPKISAEKTADDSMLSKSPNKGLFENRLGDSIVIEDLFRIQAPLVTSEGISEDSYGFENANKLVVTLAGVNWWKDKTYTDKELLATSGFQEHPKFQNDVDIAESFTGHNMALFDCEPIEWAESKFGSRFSEIVRELGVLIYPFNPAPVMTFTDEHGVEQQKKLKPELNDLVIGRWQTPNGFTLTQLGQVYKNKQSGKEFVYWYIEALARSRYSIESRRPHPSKTTYIPYLLQTALYLGETSFPGTAGAMITITNRHKEFGVDEGTQLPLPYVQTLENTRVTSILESDPTNLITFFAPELTKLGYIFDDSMTDSELRKFLPPCLDALSIVPGILLDGFANFGLSENLAINFQLLAGSDFAMPEGQPFCECGLLVPGLIYGELVRRFENAYNQLYVEIEKERNSSSKKKLLEINQKFFDLADLGVGSIAFHAANTACFTLINEQLFGEGPINLLRTVAKYPTDFQNANALSNLALMQILADDLASAEVTIEDARIAIKNRFDSVVNSLNSVGYNAEQETDIILEIYQTFFDLKSKLGKINECKAIAQEVIEYCENFAPDAKILNTAKSFV